MCRRKSSFSFPFYQIHRFRRAFGEKEKLVSHFKEFCESHAGHDDVLALCPADAVPGHSNSNVREESSEIFGFVYLLKSGRYYKIGHTNAVGRRERELAIQLPDSASTVHSIRTDDPEGIESYWHRRFAAKRKNGEWFELDASEVKAFRRRTFM